MKEEDPSGNVRLERLVRPTVRGFLMVDKKTRQLAATGEVQGTSPIGVTAPEIMGVKGGRVKRAMVF